MKTRVIIAGGGAGAYFSRNSDSQRIEKSDFDIDILFVGANNRMEMKRVPEAGYPIQGIDMYGLQRSFTLKNIIANLKLPFRIWLQKQAKDYKSI